jgi:undecaprenyl-diphosphatase
VWPALRSLRFDTPSLIAVAIVAWATFLVTAVLVAIDPPSRIDHDVQERVAAFWSDLTARAPVLRGLSTVVGRLGWTPVEAAAMVAVGLVSLARGRSLRPMVLPVCSYFAVAASVGILKVTYQRPEPFFWLGRSSRSFPSGHSATAVAVYGGIALAIVLAGREWWPTRRRATLIGLATVIVLVMSAMLLRSAHWISDIGGGAALGTAWLTTIAAVALRLGLLPGTGELRHLRPQPRDPAAHATG